MGVYEDMASDAGYKFGTDENKQMARAIEEQQMREQEEEWQRRDWEREQYERIDRGEFDAPSSEPQQPTGASTPLTEAK